MYTLVFCIAILLRTVRHSEIQKRNVTIALGKSEYVMSKMNIGQSIDSTCLCFSRLVDKPSLLKLTLGNVISRYNLYYPRDTTCLTKMII